MSKSNYLSIILFITLINCSNNEDQSNKNNYSDCINAKIQEILQSPIQNPKATVKKYTYLGQTVYLINSNFADALDPVYNDKCELVCTQGGIGGNSNNSCVNWDSAVYIETVWTDPR